ncbi:MAG: methyltransferase domain-containing protein [Dehalococcoidales bacterium]|nr:methyltransferase domain-containing protein [Dehalococcoidales bacterium]
MHRDAFKKIALYCTDCRTFEHGRIIQHKLDLSTDKISGEYVISGHFECLSCGKQFPIIGGVPCLVSSISTHEDLTNQYLDAHYSEINNEYWNTLDTWYTGNLCLDAGCSTGRYTFDCGKKGFTIGIDIKLEDLRLATEFQRTGKVAFTRKTRTLAHEEIESSFEPSENVLFLQADINNPPFGTETFDFISGLNLIDSVRLPLTTLGQMDAMLKRSGRLLLSTPYAWDPEISEEFLEDKDTDPHTFVKKLLTGDIIPETGFHYRILEEKTGIPWLMRKHDTLHFRYNADLIIAEKL